MDDIAAVTAKQLHDPGDVRTPRAKVSVAVKATSGAGALVETVSTAVFQSFMFFFYTALLGLPGTLVGAATAISLVVDAIADPMLGSWSDNTRSRWGRRVPFMILGAPAVALGLGLMFTPPGGLSTPALFGWLLAMSLLMRFAVSAFNVPFTALGAELSEDYAERSSVVAYRTIYSILGPLLILLLGYGVFLSGRQGLRNVTGYAPLAWTAAAVLLVGGAVSVLGVRRFAAGLAVPARHDTALYRRFLGEVAEIFRNPSFRTLFVATVLFYAAQGVAGALTQHMNLFVWRIDSSQIFMVTLCLFAGLMLGVPLVPILARRMEKRDVVIMGLIVLCLAQGGLSGLRALGLFTLTGAAVVGPLGLNSFLAGVGLTAAGISVASMMADAADEHDFLFKARREGLYFAGLGFAGKAATGLGSLVAGIALDTIHFPRMAAAQGAAAHLSPATLSHLAVAHGPLAALVSLVATSFLFFYRIDRRRHDEITAALRARRAKGR
jgi:GPH family glycoside/pentoside/hexuronide:cation symporter